MSHDLKEATEKENQIRSISSVNMWVFILQGHHTVEFREISYAAGDVLAE